MIRMLEMRRWILASLVATSLVALSPAPIIDERRNVQLEPERSQEQRTAEQQGQRIGEVGAVEANTERKEIPRIEGDASAAATVQGATKVPDAKATIRQASRQINAQRPADNPFRFFWGALILVAAFGLVQVFRMWANKAIPDMPTTYK